MADTRDKTAQKRKQEAEVLAFLQERAQEVQQGDAALKGRRVSLAAAREGLFLKQFEEVASRVFSQKITPAGYSRKAPKKKPERILNMLLSDLHFQALLDPREVPFAYGPTEEARRLAAILVQAAEYKTQYRDKTTLSVNLLGDIIQGQLHDPRDGAPQAQQVCAAIYLLSQAIGFLASQFPRVVVRCTPGNHGRNGARHHDRAVNQKWDSIETIVYFSLKQQVSSLPNVTVEIPYTPYITYDLFGERAFLTHGDTVFAPGSPGKAIDIASIDRKINGINGALQPHERYGLFAIGHVHVASMTRLPSGAVFISNGCLIPTDSYGLSIGSFSIACGQWLWESVQGHIVGDSRFMSVDRHTDRDASLDKIVKPFLGL